MKSEHISDLEMIVSLNIVNDTEQEQSFAVLSSYLDGLPLSYFSSISYKPGDKFNIRLSNVAADMLWKNENQKLNYTTILTTPFKVDEITK